MKKYIAKRVLISVFTLLAITLVLFILLQLMPGSPFNDEKLSDDQRAVLYEKYGLDKPIIVHDRQAHADVYALLKKYRPKGIVHCYSGSAEDAVQLAAQGLYIGFGGACTFNGAKRAAKAIDALPLDAIVLETDCPYMAPEPVRGTRCDSCLIRYVGAYIAQRKALAPEEVFRATAANARRVFGL